MTTELTATIEFISYFWKAGRGGFFFAFHVLKTWRCIQDKDGLLVFQSIRVVYIVPGSGSHCTA